MKKFVVLVRKLFTLFACLLSSFLEASHFAATGVLDFPWSPAGYKESGEDPCLKQII